MLLNKEYHPEKLCCWLVAFICYHWSWLCASQDTDFNLFRMQLLKFYPRFEEKKGSCHSSYSITSAGYELLSENILGFSSWYIKLLISFFLSVYIVNRPLRSQDVSLLHRSKSFQHFFVAKFKLLRETFIYMRQINHA